VASGLVAAAGQPGRLHLSIDLRMLTTTAQRAVMRHAAVRRSLDGYRPGEIVASRRKKLPHERSQPAHGAMILAVMRSRGREWINIHSEQVVRTTTEVLGRRILHELMIAGRTGEVRRAGIDRAFLVAAKSFAAWNRRYIATGKLGKRPATQADEKSGLHRDLTQKWSYDASRGRVSLRHGNPPPVGWLSGRLSEGSSGGETDGIRGVSGRPVMRA
jgi:hypothetical protein